MAKRKRIPLGQAPPYPTDVEAKAYANSYADNILPQFDCHAAFAGYEHNQSIDALCTWGCQGIFFVFAYPPAGFVIAKPEDVLKLQTFEGWILERIPGTNNFNLLVKASREGVDYFWQAHRRYSH